jgi:DNA replication protein DnaC
MNKYDMAGITNSKMTNRERLNAVSAYWKEEFKRMRKERGNRQLDPIETKMESAGCNCDGAGWYLLVYPSGQQEMKKCNCGIAGPSPEETRLNSELSVLQHKVFSNFTIDRPYKALPDASADVQKRMVQIAVQKAKAYAKDPTGFLYIHGLPGTGKSHLAAAIANHLKRHGWSIAYRSVPAMLDLIRDSASRGQVDALYQSLAKFDLVVYDDIGADNTPTDWADAHIFRLVNERVDMPTIYTSNHDVSQLPYSPRIIDRLNASRRCWINASSMRKEIV